MGLELNNVDSLKKDYPDLFPLDTIFIKLEIRRIYSLTVFLIFKILLVINSINH